VGYQQFHMIAGAPDPVAPFSRAVETDGWVFITGQMLFVNTSVATPYPEGTEVLTHPLPLDANTEKAISPASPRLF
jgi:2-iminobutanoate/2-iminopropanoate deaminase